MSRAAPPAGRQTALGDWYRVERELPGGGMSRLFIATELAFGRQVVVKVLPAELASTTSRERFRREITLAARKQLGMRRRSRRVCIATSSLQRSQNLSTS